MKNEVKFERIPNFTLPYIFQSVRNVRYIKSFSTFYLTVVTQQTILGLWWLVLRATLPTIGIAFILEQLIQDPKSPIPYALHLISGMTLWSGVNIGIVRGLRCQNVARRYGQNIFASKCTIVLSSLSLPFFYMFVFLLFLYGSIVYFEMWVHLHVFEISGRFLLAPLMLAMSLIAIAGVVSFLSTLFTMARDFRFISPLLVQLWMFCTPIIYPIQFYPANLRDLVLIGNPFAAIIEVFRYSLFIDYPINDVTLISAFTGPLVLFYIGSWFLRRSNNYIDELV